MALERKTFPWLRVTAAAGMAVALLLALVDGRGPADVAEVSYPREGSGGVELRPLVENGEANSALPSAELFLHDPTPLFLPTIYNSGRVEPTMTAERSQGTSFEEIEPKLVFPEVGNRLAVPDVVRVQGSALGILEQLAPDVSLRELARAETDLRSLPRRTAMIEVRRVADGQVVWRGAVGTGQPRELELVPIDVMVVIDDAGMLTDRGSLEVAAGGGTLPLLGQQQLDLGELENLLHSARLGARLTGGIYRISLGP